MLKIVGLINQASTIEWKGLNSPPVREFYEDAVIVLAIPAWYPLQVITIDTKEEHGSRSQDPAYQEASVKFIVFVVVVNDGPQGQGFGKLVRRSLTHGVEIIDLLSSSILPESLFTEIYRHLKPFIRFNIEIKSVGITPSKKGIIRIIKDAVACPEIKPERNPANQVVFALNT